MIKIHYFFINKYNKTVKEVKNCANSSIDLYGYSFFVRDFPGYFVLRMM